MTGHRLLHLHGVVVVVGSRAISLDGRPTPNGIRRDIQQWSTRYLSRIASFSHTHTRARARTRARAHTHAHTHTHMHSTPPLIVIVFSRLDRGIQSATEMLPLILKSGRRCCLHLFQSGNGFQILKRGSRDPIWGNLSFVEVSYDSGPTPCEFS